MPGGLWLFGAVWYVAGMNSWMQRVRLLLTGLLIALALVATADRAQARGTVQLHTPVVKEDDGSWKIRFTINYGSIPHMNHIPVIFSFKPTAIYERALTDASPKKPVRTRKPIVNGKALNVSDQIGFADMSGKLFKITKYKTKLTRRADFEAGEYDLTIKLVGGGVLGRRMHLKLQGDNKAIDRRAVVFTAKAPEKKEEKKSWEEPENDGKPRAVEDMGPDLSDIPDLPDSDAEPQIKRPPSENPRQGGCGCTQVGSLPPSRLGWLSALALGALVVLRRRR
jgi:MYXO-CTERM domain-containing protein